MSEQIFTTETLLIPPHDLEGLLTLPPGAIGLVIFAHGSGSSRLSVRNNHVARCLNEAGLATLLFDLLTDDEAQDRRLVFDIPFLTERLLEVTDWAAAFTQTRRLAPGYFGSSTGAAAALCAAAQKAGEIAAVVSRGGRPDLAMSQLPRVEAPTLLIVGARDEGVVELNQQAYDRLRCEKSLQLVPRATHLFEEPGTLDAVSSLARVWFRAQMAASRFQRNVYPDRRDAGQRLADLLFHLKAEDPLIMAIPRGGVPVAAEIARALDAPVDLVLVRKLGAPYQPELAIGAVVDGNPPAMVLNHDILAHLNLPPGYLEGIRAQQLEEIERRRKAYLGDAPPAQVRGRTVIVVDDGIATGATVLAALKALRQQEPKRLVLAVPVAAPDSLARMRDWVDEVVCPFAPEDLIAIGCHYGAFPQLSDDEVVAILEEIRKDSR